MSRRGQRSGARWCLGILAGCLAITIAHAQQTAGSDDQGGFVVIEDTSSVPPPRPLALLVTPAQVSSATAVAPKYKPLPTLPPNALPLIERTPPTTLAPHPKPLATTSVARHPPTSFVVPVKKKDDLTAPYTIPAGTMISAGLARYVERYGWSMRWLVADDYRLDAPLPIPAGGMKAGVTYVMRAYQAWGGLMGDVPRFADPNHVVVIQPVTAATGVR